MVAAQSALLLLACVGDTPITTPDAATDSSASDSAAGDGGGPGSDGGMDGTLPPDSGPCSSAPIGNNIQLPTSGALPVARLSGPVVAGDYLLTGGGYGCLGCPTVSSSAAGGLRITVAGPSVTIERRVDFQVTQQPQQNVLDRWTGTYNSLGSRLVMTRVCPDGGAAADWPAILPVTDAGPQTLEVQFPQDLVGRIANDGGVLAPTFVFTRQ